MIDFHTHIFPEHMAAKTLEFLRVSSKSETYSDATAGGLVSSAAEAGIDLSVILPVATRPGQFQTINRYAMQFRGQNGLLSFGGIHPDSEDYREELRFLADHGFKGIKLHPVYQRTFIDDIRYQRIISLASELGLIVTIHAGHDPSCQNPVFCDIPRIIRMVETVRPEKLVLAHMGGYLMWDEVERDLLGIPAWFDTGVVFGFIDDDQFMRIARGQGIERILFATDSPWAAQKAFADHIRSLPFTEDELLRICHTNAEELLGMKVPVSDHTGMEVKSMSAERR